MIILGISGSAHDPSASIIIDEKVICSIEEERLSRVKHAPHSLPILSTREVIKQAKIKPSDIDKVAYFINPKIFEKGVLKHVLISDPKKYLLNPSSYNTLRFMNRGKRYETELKKLLKAVGIKAPIEYIRHHLTHASSAYYFSPFDKSMILSIDNMGELDSTLLAKGIGNDIKIISSQNIPHSLGMLYATITNFLGFRAWSEEGKVMALAAYGKPSIPFSKIASYSNGKFKIKKDFQMIQTKDGKRMFSKSLVKILGPPRKRDEELTQRHYDIAASLQFAIEEISKQLVRYLYGLTGLRNLCICGGVALNCKLNGELSKLPFIDNVYVFPAAGDSGTSLGAAIYSHMNSGGSRPDPIFGANLGVEYNNDDVLNALEKFNLKFEKIKNPAKEAANLLVKEDVIAWFQGKSEFGPRALGYRSILGLPQKTSTKDYINEKIKYRELWRPLCPSILGECSDKYFEDASYGRFMNVAVQSKELAKNKVPAVLHIDGTSRIQKVYENENKLYYDLLKIVGEKTGDPILLNTSFNVKEPLVETPEDALKTFYKMPIKSMIIGNYKVTK